MKFKKPFNDKTLIRILLIILIVISLLAGYYKTVLDIERKKYNRLEDWYVRVRNMLGREETQRLIDLSRELEEDELSIE